MRSKRFSADLTPDARNERRSRTINRRASRLLAALAFFFILHTFSFILPAQAQSVGINIAVPDNSALLELLSTTQGFLSPRVTTAQMLAITAPAIGDLVFNTTVNGFYYYNGTIWEEIAGGTDWSITGNSGTNPSTNFLGTIDAEDLVQKSNSLEHLRVFAPGGVGLTNTTDSAESLIFYEPSDSGALYTAFRAGVQTTTVHYIWPPADGLPNQALVTDGAGNLSWYTFATFGGGGSQSLWKRGSAAGGEYSDSSGNSDSGPYSIVGGHNNNVTGNYEMVWGSGNFASGSYGSIQGVNNTSTGDLDAFGGGEGNSNSATATFIGGGESNATSGDDEVVLGGSGNSFSGSNSTILGGNNNKISSNYELVYGSGVTVGGGTGLVIFKTGPTTKFGIGTVSPSEALDVAGNINFSGALKPAGSGGSSGRYLLSSGAGAAPSWGTISLPSTNWRLTGNTGSSPTTNYIGTTDANDFVIRTSDVERMRVFATGQIGINTTANTHQLQSVLSGVSDETAAIYGVASGSAIVQSLGIWGDANNNSSNTGTLAALATGNGNSSAGTTNAALQINDGEFAMGRTTEAPSAGFVVEPAASGTAYSQQGPSGVIQLSMITDLSSSPPVSGFYQDLGAVTIYNQYITSSSIILAGVVAKGNGGGAPDPNNSVYKVDVESRSAGSCVLRIGMFPFVTVPSLYQGSDYIRIGYIVINPGR